ATLKELSRFGRIPLSTLRGRLKRLTELGLVGAVSHHLGSLGPHPQQRYFPRERGIVTGGRIEHGTERFLSAYPVSRRWFRLWAERLDAVAVLYRVAAMVADADPHAEPLRVDHYRQGPYDMLLTLSGGRSIGVIRQGAMLPSANLRYRLRTAENLHYRNTPRATLVIACSDQANRRAVRTLRDPVKHHTTFVTTEGELLVGDHRSVVWQRCDNGRHNHPPPEVSPDVSLTDIVRRVGGRPNDPQPNPAALYPERLRATMPEPSEQLGFSLAVLLTRAEKDALDLLSAWPLSTTEQLARLMGGLTRRRANQVLGSLRERNLVREDDSRHVVTGEGLTYLARRNRASVRMTLGRWTPRLRRSRNGAGRVYAGTSLRTMANQLPHHDAVTTLAAAFTAEAAHSPNHEHEVLELLPTSRSSIGYTYGETGYVVHPDASLLLAHWGEWRYYLLEVERRAVTPRRVRTRLENYRRYFDSRWAARDHGGRLPLVLFVFETPGAEEGFLGAARRLRGIPLFTSNLALIGDRGVLGDTWRPGLPHPADRLTVHRLHELAS
ncbi:MAG: replication-relaxation family protein, partial [Deltaproteobacteria bacterium]|nr:replication-relaxation family protein [Deltaproteobacteria bacterium]